MTTVADATCDAGCDPVERVDPRVERSRAKLLAAATDLLVEAGPQALTVDQVAERSGVAKSTLYRHWPSRTALMVDVLRQIIPRTPDVDLASGFEPCLREYVRVLAESFADPEWARILPGMFALRQQFPEVREITDADRAQKVAVMATMLVRGAAEGLVPEGLDPNAVATFLAGPMMMSAIVGDPAGARSAGEYAVDRFLDSYAPKA